MDGQTSPSSPTAAHLTFFSITRIEQWLQMQVGRAAGLLADEIDVQLPFSHYALDSVATVELTADLEDWLELRLEPTLLWDYPTIAALARHLNGLKATPQ
jgi:acyl carrier protein